MIESGICLFVCFVLFFVGFFLTYPKEALLEREEVKLKRLCFLCLLDVISTYPSLHTNITSTQSLFLKAKTTLFTLVLYFNTFSFSVLKFSEMEIADKSIGIYMRSSVCSVKRELIRIWFKWKINIQRAFYSYISDMYYGSVCQYIALRIFARSG